MKPRNRKPRSVLLARQAEEQERIREIHSALGGSADAFERASDGPRAEDVTLGSRIDAYVKLQTARRGSAPVAEPVEAEPLYEPPLVVEEPPPTSLYDPPPLALEEPPTPLYEPPPLVIEEPTVVEPPPSIEEPPAAGAEPPVQLVATPVASPPATRRVREPRGLARGFRASARTLVQLAVGVGRVLSALARLPVRGIGRAVSATHAVRARPPRPARSREERRDAERLAPSVLQRVQGYTPSAADDAPAAIVPDRQPGPEPEKVEPVAPPPPPPSPPAAPRQQPREARVAGRLRVGPRLLLLAAALGGAAAAAVLVVDRGDSVGVSLSARQHAAAMRAMANVSTSRASFSNPGAYASAMTLLALANGKTHVSSQPSCDEQSTWKRWSCDAKGLPSVGPFAGRWVTYRCTPSYAPQPAGAPAALVVNCRPQTA